MLLQGVVLKMAEGEFGKVALQLGVPRSWGPEVGSAVMAHV